MQYPARVAGGRAYYADGSGIVRQLARDGSVKTVADFALQNDGSQSLSFAVSPDAHQVVASVLTVLDSERSSQSTYRGRARLELKLAAGGQTQTIREQVLDLSNLRVPESLQVVGWDEVSPIVTQNTWLYGDLPHVGRYFGGPLARLSLADGTVTQVLGSEQCTAVADLVQERKKILCAMAGRILQVQDYSGKLVWQTRPGFSQGVDDLLSPDAQRIVGIGEVVESNGISRSVTPFDPLGWLDSETVVGGVVPPSSAPNGHNQIVIARLSGSGSLQDLRIQGMFVGQLP